MLLDFYSAGVDVGACPSSARWWP